MLEIIDLSASIEGQSILKKFSLKVPKGQIHAIMGPNGAGKSTLAKVLAGHPSYEMTDGKIILDSQEIQELDPSERSLLGLFMSFQYPPEIEGVPMMEFLKATTNAHRTKQGLEPFDEKSFDEHLSKIMKSLQMRPEFKERSVNEGFSGGEKKRHEILQMALAAPKLAILDETDSGLDIDALKSVAAGIQALSSKDNAIVLITHYQRLLEYVKPDVVHVMIGGKIVKSGDAKLALELEARGYDWLDVSDKPGV